jgi:hypothetical protein
MSDDLITEAATDFHNASVKFTKAGWTKEQISRYLVDMAKRIRLRGVAIHEPPKYEGNIIPFPNPEEVEGGDRV